MSDTPRTDDYARSKPSPERWEWIAKCAEVETDLTAANERIKRLEEAGDELLMWLGEDISESNGQLLQDAWNKAKEAKP